MVGKGFDANDANLRAAIREQVGSVVKRLHRQATIESVSAEYASRWKPASAKERAAGAYSAA
jgi:hypothetical protein